MIIALDPRAFPTWQDWVFRFNQLQEIEALSGGGGGGGGAPVNATYLTSTDQTMALPNSRMLVAGANITFDLTVAGQFVINASGGGGAGGYPPQLGYAGVI